MPRGTSDPVRATQHRKQILDILSAGPIVDDAGLAIQKLQAETGHETTNALTKVLRQMEHRGLVKREVRGRRTFRIELVGAQADAAEDRSVEDEARAFEGDAAAFAQVSDLDIEQLEILAGILLKTALRALQAQEDGSAVTKDELRRLRTALLSAETRAADAEALRAEVKDKLAEILDLRERIRIAEQNVDLLKLQLDKPKHRKGYSIEEIISADERKELAKLQRQVPRPRD